MHLRQLLVIHNNTSCANLLSNSQHSNSNIFSTICRDVKFRPY
ncbi:hypothetical protein HMPREF0868_0442 [Mageeibacillus indolicus UPII9-5]|uniref:Uncharacterized protein n=1 Tax=Mageeibacillus indolicus (strain UPII9-5) TaxID=699246 RepID=D3R0R8_MAGIU|nr:hypothetical protein HMPREF0868_0442 [Mageeibacillus indolicus UPII9-5]